MIDKRLAHLTWERVSGEPHEWRYAEVAADLVAVADDWSEHPATQVPALYPTFREYLVQAREALSAGPREATSAARFCRVGRAPADDRIVAGGTKVWSLASNPCRGGVMSFRPLNAHVSLVICAMVLAPAACGSQAPDPVRFSKVMVISDDGATIQLVADICQGQPYTTVVK